jgi:formate-dependent nitrite reductase membrane component NrfD
MENKIIGNLFKRLINSKDGERSSKRFVTLVIAFHFILASFFILFLFAIVYFKTINGDLELIKAITPTFEKILEYDFYIVIVGLGFITSENFAQVLLNNKYGKSTEETEGGN